MSTKRVPCGNRVDSVMDDGPVHFCSYETPCDDCILEIRGCHMDYLERLKRMKEPLKHWGPLGEWREHPGIKLGRVMAIEIRAGDTVAFYDNCDQALEERFESKSEAIAALQEAIDWIRSQA